MAPLSSSRESGMSFLRSAGAVALIVVGTAAAAVWYADAARPGESASPESIGDIAGVRGTCSAPTEAGSDLRAPSCRVRPTDVTGGSRARFVPLSGPRDPMTVLPAGEARPAACSAASDQDPAALTAPDDA